MQLIALTTELAPLLLSVLDEPPEPEDVKAGWTAFAIFLLLGLAVALLGVGLTKQLRRTEANRRAGAFGPVEDPADEDADGTGPGDSPRP